MRSEGEPDVWAEQRVRQAWHAAVLALVLGAAWISLLGVGRGEWSTAGELPRPAVVAAAPQAAVPVVPEARLAGKPTPCSLLLFVAAIAAVLFGTRRHLRWPVAAARTCAATPSLLLHAMRGRAPPRRLA
ncbi:hypothetical protein [Actinoplanes utahensis]|uniref:Uncharacterized protein n=1 Tax=Actinoplanes utahensis TaxID=1869 RepID=A0A0A6X0T5_ACTUT|nr:hypothetical protein [Actinoplanes utahensis]KHD73637.1 hypothetical protein MB27_33180 [Actinoplanes utahensis]GIF33984.1 hypothetical protein Aut01nite_69700 [Actinoplanes utahensis]